MNPTNPPRPIESVHSQPEPEHIARAALTLARVLAGKPPMEAGLAAGGALAILTDVYPPYPPHPEPGDLDPLPVEAGLRAAFDALVEAIDDATGIPELARIARAGRELRLYLEQHAPDGLADEGARER